MTMSAKVCWTPLEANEDAFNEYIDKLGVRGAKCIEIWDFDEHIPIIEKPHYALILCYSDYKKVDEFMKPVYNKLKEEGVSVPQNAFFMHQKISNACGTFALLHALAQNVDKIDIGNGSFSKWLKKAKELDVESRSDSLAEDKEFAAIHQQCAESGATGTPNADAKIENHFICYVHIDGRLYEFDSRMDFPRDCGATSQDTLLLDAVKICRELLVKANNTLAFNALALVGKQN